MIYKTIDDIKAAHERRGGFFFTPSTMRFFSSRVLSPVFPGGVFITSERDRGARIIGGYVPAAWGGERRYTVRVCNSAGDILPASEFGEFATRDAAIAWAKEYAAGVTA
jgi:hypothetical protein